MSHDSGVTACPKCGAVGTYRVTMLHGGQAISCHNCRKTFIAEVKHGQFTGRNR